MISQDQSKSRVNIKKIDVKISFATHGSSVIVSSETDSWTFNVEDPFDLIHDVFEAHSEFNFYFEESTVSYFVPITEVPRSFFDSDNLHYVDGGKFICIYSGNFSEAIHLMASDTPIPQHCYRYFQLFVNACTYLRTIQNIKS